VKQCKILAIYVRAVRVPCRVHSVKFCGLQSTTFIMVVQFEKLSTSDTMRKKLNACTHKFFHKEVPTRVEKAPRRFESWAVNLNRGHTSSCGQWH
jgi:hypothetical protein